MNDHPPLAIAPQKTAASRTQQGEQGARYRNVLNYMHEHWREVRCPPAVLPLWPRSCSHCSRLPALFVCRRIQAEQTPYAVLQRGFAEEDHHACCNKRDGP